MGGLLAVFNLILLRSLEQTASKVLGESRPYAINSEVEI